MSSIFTRIIHGEIPSYKIYEDEHCFAFLTIEPLTLGHTLLIPKQEIGILFDVEDTVYHHLMMVAKNILAPAIQEATSCLRVGVLVEGFGVPDHAHIHLIPLMQTGQMNSGSAHTESPENMAIVAKKIVENLPYFPLKKGGENEG